MVARFASGGACLVLSGCLGFSQGASCIDQTGVLIDEVGMETHRLLDLGAVSGRGARGAGRGGPWIFEILPLGGARGHLVVAADGAVWMAPGGEVMRRVRFETGERYFPVRAIGTGIDSTGSPGFVFIAVPWKGDGLVAFDGEGRLLWSRDVKLTAWAWIEPGDFNGNGRSEVLIGAHGGGGAHVFDLAGRHLALVRSEHYLTAYRAADVDGDGEDEIVLYGWPNQKRGGTFEIFDVRWNDSGGYEHVERLERWATAAFGDFRIAPAPTGALAILSTEDDALVWTSFQGREIHRLPAPRASCFRYVFASALGQDYQVFALDGRGYTSAHAIYVYDSQERLVFHEIIPGHLRSLTVLPEDTDEVLFARKDAVWRYRLSRLP